MKDVWGIREEFDARIQKVAAPDSFRRLFRKNGDYHSQSRASTDARDGESNHEDAVFTVSTTLTECSFSNGARCQDMNRATPRIALALAVAMLAIVTAGSGCSNVGAIRDQVQESREYAPEIPYPNDTPRELKKVSLPTYTIEPPDILLIDVVNPVPKFPYRIRELDQLRIEAAQVLPMKPIQGTFTVESGGMAYLGEPYGYVQVGKMTLSEASQAITEHLKQMAFRNPEVSVSLFQYAGRQQITGEHMVGPDGKVSLGIYGEVYVTGMTEDEAPGRSGALVAAPGIARGVGRHLLVQQQVLLAHRAGSRQRRRRDARAGHRE